MMKSASKSQDKTSLSVSASVDVKTHVESSTCLAREIDGYVTRLQSVVYRCDIAAWAQITLLPGMEEVSLC